MLLRSFLRFLRGLLLLALLSRILLAPLRVLGRLFLPLLFGQYLLLLCATLRVLRGLLLSPTLGILGGLLLLALLSRILIAPLCVLGRLFLPQLFCLNLLLLRATLRVLRGLLLGSALGLLGGLLLLLTLLSRILVAPLCVLSHLFLPLLFCLNLLLLRATLRILRGLLLCPTLCFLHL